MLRPSSTRIPKQDLGIGNFENSPGGSDMGRSLEITLTEQFLTLQVAYRLAKQANKQTQHLVSGSMLN